MDPDQLHDLYAKAFKAVMSEVREHGSMSKETRDAISELDKRFEEKIDSFKDDISKQLESKVSYNWFWAVVGILCTVVVGMFYLVYNQNINTQEQLKLMNDKAVVTNNKTIEIDSQLKALKIIQ